MWLTAGQAATQTGVHHSTASKHRPFQTSLAKARNQTLSTDIEINKLDLIVHLIIKKVVTAQS
jgi:hypothetical protein